MCGLWVPNWLYTFKVASILVNSSTSNNIDICSQFSIKNSNFLSMTHKFGKSQFVSFRFQTHQFSKIPYFLIQFPPLNSFCTLMYCDIWISKFKKEQFPRKLLYEGIRYVELVSKAINILIIQHNVGSPNVVGRHMQLLNSSILHWIPDEFVVEPKLKSKMKR